MDSPRLFIQLWRIHPRAVARSRISRVARGLQPLDGARGYLSPREGALPGGQVILAPSLFPAAAGGKVRNHMRESRFAKGGQPFAWGFGGCAPDHPSLSPAAEG